MNMSLTYKHDFEAEEIIDVILNAIRYGLENQLRIMQNIERSGPTKNFKFAIVTDEGCLWINDYEANSFGADNNTIPIQKRLHQIGCKLSFVW
jgi:hypothetical protein